jgi:hypothetical protein
MGASGGALGRRALIRGGVGSLALLAASAAGPDHWPERQANAWYDRLPWLVGCDFIPSNAVNQIEMWQAATFDPVTMEREIGWAAALGMNALRVFLHDLVWSEDPAGLLGRVDRLLAIAARCGIRVMPVLFDSCWDPFPRTGPQPPPVPGVHNSRWVQSPGAAALQSPAERPRLERYVRGVVGRFRDDPRVLAWDIWNEPDNCNPFSYGAVEPADKVELVLALLPRAFAWARSAAPQQPLTSGVWAGDWSSAATLTPVQRLQLEASDVISFHNYQPPADFSRRVAWLRRWGRPLLCTEYMARPLGSTVEAILPLARSERVAALNWGLVAGKTQTYLPWDSWAHPYVGRPAPSPWFHDLLYPDRGQPYRDEEARVLHVLTGTVGREDASVGVSTSTGQPHQR